MDSATGKQRESCKMPVGRDEVLSALAGMEGRRRFRQAGEETEMLRRVQLPSNIPGGSPPLPRSASYQVDELGDGDFADGLPHPAQGFQGGPEAAGQVVAADGEEVILAPVEVKDQDLLDLVLPRIQKGHRVLADVDIQGDVHRLVWDGEKTRESFKTES